MMSYTACVAFLAVLLGSSELIDGLREVLDSTSSEDLSEATARGEHHAEEKTQYEEEAEEAEEASGNPKKVHKIIMRGIESIPDGDFDAATPATKTAKSTTLENLEDGQELADIASKESCAVMMRGMMVYLPRDLDDIGTGAVHGFKFGSGVTWSTMSEAVKPDFVSVTSDSKGDLIPGLKNPEWLKANTDFTKDLTQCTFDGLSKLLKKASTTWLAQNIQISAWAASVAILEVCSSYIDETGRGDAWKLWIDNLQRSLLFDVTAAWDKLKGRQGVMGNYEKADQKCKSKGKNTLPPTLEYEKQLSAKLTKLLEDYKYNDPVKEFKSNVKKLGAARQARREQQYRQQYSQHHQQSGSAETDMPIPKNFIDDKDIWDKIFKMDTKGFFSNLETAAKAAKESQDTSGCSEAKKACRKWQIQLSMTFHEDKIIQQTDKYKEAGFENFDPALPGNLKMVKAVQQYINAWADYCNNAC